MKFQLIRSTRLHYRTQCIYKTRHRTRFLSTHQNATSEKWREFHSHLKSLINTLPPYPFKPPPTYSPKIDTLLDHITPILQQMTFQPNERQLIVSADSVSNRRLLKLASFQMHRHRRALDLNNLYMGVDRESTLRDQSKVEPFATYTRKLDQILSLGGWGCYPGGSGIRILTLDGGGSRGLVALELMSALEEETGRRLRDMFDLVYGTSTGAIIIFLHFICKIQLPDCIKLYKQFSHQIFNQSTLAAAKQLLSTQSVYNADVLREFLSDQSSVQLPMWMVPCSASQPRLGVVATHVGNTPQPYLFRNFRIPSVSKYEGVCDVTWMDAILGSTAAPGYFPEYNIGSSTFQDGGLVANNPSAIALHEASLLWPEHKIQCLVSIGTGKISNFESLVETASPRTTFRDKLRVLVYCITSSSNGTHDTLSDLLPMIDVPYFRLNPGFPKEVPLDESREEELNFIVDETKKYISHNKPKFVCMREALLREPTRLQKFIKQIKMSI